MAEEGKGKKRALRWAFAAAAAFGLYHLMAPGEQTVMPEGERGPNEVQQEFVRLAAEKYDYVTLGDTRHDDARVSIFGIHTDMVGALAAGGKTRLFLETAPDAEYYFDAVALEIPTRTGWADHNMWLCDDNVKQVVTNEFERSLRDNQTVTFTGVDQRNVEGSEASALMRSPLVSLGLGLPVAAYSAVYGCVATAAFIPGGIIMALTGQDEKMFELISDDRDTTNLILSHPEKGGAIFYGAGHYSTKANSMQSLLRAEGYTVGQINVYFNAHGAADRKAISPDDEPGAHLYVTDIGDGIETFTPEMDALHRQAIENVKRRPAQPAPFPAG